MNWFKFLMVDMRLMKSQKLFLVVFPLFAIIIGASSEDLLFTISYMCFGVMIVSTTPFFLENKNMSSFIQLLPGNDRDKVVGRYTGFLAMLFADVIIGVVACAVLDVFGYQIIQNGNMYISAAVIAVSVIVGSLQFIIFYATGREKSEQWLNILRIIPAFLFFFGTNYIIESLEKHKEQAEDILRFTRQNQLLLLAVGVVLAAIVFFVCIQISTTVVKRQDVS
ncbi:MAG: ABC-2 transporter permease [Roseburia sp.]|nr:ABC-2 transporter permease [Roseburia sp.]